MTESDIVSAEIRLRRIMRADGTMSYTVSYTEGAQPGELWELLQAGQIEVQTLFARHYRRRTDD